MNENLPQHPPNMFNIVERNREDYAHAEAPLVPRPLDAPAFQREVKNGAPVLDTRSPHNFGEEHIPGALHVYLHGSAFATRVGFIASPDSRLLLVVRDERDLHEATTQLAVVGYDQVAGYLEGGMATWQEAGLPIQQLSQIAVWANRLPAMWPYRLPGRVGSIRRQSPVTSGRRRPSDRKSTRLNSSHQIISYAVF